MVNLWFGNCIIKILNMLLKYVAFRKQNNSFNLFLVQVLFQKVCKSRRSGMWNVIQRADGRRKMVGWPDHFNKWLKVKICIQFITNFDVLKCHLECMIKYRMFTAFFYMLHFSVFLHTLGIQFQWSVGVCGIFLLFFFYCAAYSRFSGVFVDIHGNSSITGPS